MWIVKASFLAVVLVGYVEAHANAQETITVPIDIDTRSKENTIAIGMRSIVSVAATLCAPKVMLTEMTDLTWFVSSIPESSNFNPANR